MANQLIETLLLFSLPASGKSEMRKYMASLSPTQCRDDFHIGQTGGCRANCVGESRRQQR